MTTLGRNGRYQTKVPHARAREKSLGSFRPKRPKPSNVDVDDELGLSLDDLDTCLDAARLDGQRHVKPGSNGAEDGDA